MPSRCLCFTSPGHLPGLCYFASLGPFVASFRVRNPNSLLTMNAKIGVGEQFEVECTGMWVDTTAERRDGVSGSTERSGDGSREDDAPETHSSSYEARTINTRLRRVAGMSS